jgi:hypothetical protein
MIGQTVVGSPSADGSNACWYRAGTHVVVTLEIDRGVTGKPATVTDLNRLVSGISGPHASVPNLGESAVLLGNEQSSVLYVLARGWTMQVVAGTSATERNIAQAAITRL